MLMPSVFLGRFVHMCLYPAQSDLSTVRAQALTLPRSIPFAMAQSDRTADAATQAREHWQRGYDLANGGDLDQAAVEMRRAVTLAPNNSQYVYTLGIILARQGKLDEAIGYFRQSAKLDSQNLGIRQNLAAAEWQAGQLLDAERNLQFILKRKPGDPDASFLLGMVLENKGEYAQAAKLLAEVPDQVSQHPEALAAILHSYYGSSRAADAHDLEDRLARDPSQGQALILCAEVAERAGDYSSAEKMLTAARGFDLSTAEVDYELAALRYRSGRYAEAEEILKDLTTQNAETGKYFDLLGWCLAKQGKTQDAVKAFDRAIDLDPNKSSNYADVAAVLLDAGLLPPALEAANKAVAVDPNGVAAYRVQGRVEMRQHNYAAAVSSYTKAIERESHRGAASDRDSVTQQAMNDAVPDTLLDLAEAQSAAGQYQGASATLEAGIKKYPRQAQFYYQYALAVIHHDDSGSSQAKAEALLKKALALNDSIAGAHYELGNILLAQDQPDRALEQLQKAAKLDPSSADTHYALWLDLRKLGRTQEAADELQTFKKLKPQGSDAPH
jgi:tetratricopeptide (TPR) repeat protein